MFCEMLFSSQVYLKIILPEVFYATKILVLPVLLLEWNKTYCIVFPPAKIFASFFKLLKISLDAYSLFLGHVEEFF